MNSRRCHTVYVASRLVAYTTCFPRATAPVSIVTVKGAVSSTASGAAVRLSSRNTTSIGTKFDAVAATVRLPTTGSDWSAVRVRAGTGAPSGGAGYTHPAAPTTISATARQIFDTSSPPIAQVELGAFWRTRAPTTTGTGWRAPGRRRRRALVSEQVLHAQRSHDPPRRHGRVLRVGRAAAEPGAAGRARDRRRPRARGAWSRRRATRLGCTASTRPCRRPRRSDSARTRCSWRAITSTTARSASASWRSSRRSPRSWRRSPSTRPSST